MNDEQERIFTLLLTCGYHRAAARFAAVCILGPEIAAEVLPR